MTEGDGTTRRRAGILFSAKAASMLADVAMPIIVGILLLYSFKMQLDLIQTMDEDLKTAFGLTDALIVCFFMLCRRR